MAYFRTNNKIVFINKVSTYFNVWKSYVEMKQCLNNFFWDLSILIKNKFYFSKKSEHLEIPYMLCIKN